MNYKSATQSTKSSPCTNVPIYCPLCPLNFSGELPAIWKYNAVAHLLYNHPEEVTGEHNMYKLPPVPGQLMIDMFISRREEALMGIEDEVTLNWREENEIPGSDFIEDLRVEEQQKRGRSGTLSVVEPKGKRQKK